MLYKINNGAVRFGAETILENINFEIRDTEKIAVVGRNGGGKTTLLKLIAGEVDLSKRDSDEDIYIAKAGKPEIGYLKQTAFEDDTISMEREVRKAFQTILDMKAKMEQLVHIMEQDNSEQNIQAYTNLEERFNYLGGYYFEKEYEVVIKKFGFTEDDKKKPLSDFSGGQRTKIAFIKLLLSKPDILLLDEPTNHLDVSTVEWLEEYLKSYKRAVVIVSHDRMFLDKVVDVVYEIEYKTSKRYPGNYTDFVNRKRENWEKQLKDYTAQQKEIERLNTIVEKYKNTPTKVAMTRSKLKQIEHMDKIEAPDRYDLKAFHASFMPREETGNDVLSVRNLEIGYDNVLSKVSIDIKKGKKVGILGGNGLGKSTFLKTLVKQLDPLGGDFSFGVHVQIGYFDQQMAQYTSEKTVLDDYWDEFPNLMQQEIRSDLGAFLFSQDEVFKKVSMLSGGEKVRLALCRIFKRRPNFLILDEPTNHMDIVGKEALEAMLKAYTGTVLFVSHDRYFIKEVADHLLVFEQGEVKYYPYGYEEYMEDIAKRKEGMDDFSNENTGVNQLSDINSAKEKYRNNPGKEKAKKERKIKKIEELIKECEDRIEYLNNDLSNSDYASDYIKLDEIHKNISKEEEELLAYMEEWDQLQLEIESLD
ncbi:ABC-F family ATP-binding cassette domain-containing protein [Anaeromicropila herbilytica]|uniref:Putative ABC transporter ATP-binding protein YdiF n=1 Tax=Anaeromicropila herbilytica TaxID=2785025 RepID=A0A7R7ICU3_9FIRM|nr:ABC-F family ATP-binding cassette domain-containing protein [Anaeromicropila herbilytica]BCN30231.1 putative ABC transporter ATP-binding protein YdiF [Anaeromicropila herbilytica]